MIWQWWNAGCSLCQMLKVQWIFQHLIVPLFWLYFQLLHEDRFRGIDKIKTCGSTYMAAVGLSPERLIRVKYHMTFDLWPTNIHSYESKVGQKELSILFVLLTAKAIWVILGYQCNSHMVMATLRQRLLYQGIPIADVFQWATCVSSLCLDRPAEGG